MWQHRKVLVTGGASFIGSHLVDSLLARGASVRVADDLSSGTLANLEYPIRRAGKSRWFWDSLEVCQGDLKDRNFARKVMKDVDAMFHLAALHGGRGYIDTHPAECSSNLVLDGTVFDEAYKANIERICFASSACVYPTILQSETANGDNQQEILLSEEMADPFAPGKANADQEYGWAKLMGEMVLRAYRNEYGLKCVSCRIFTAYGERENETHAIIALIAKALVQMDPYEIWGTGEQDRNFTYVKDIVSGMIAATEKISDGSAVNLGTSEHIRLKEVAYKIFEYCGWKPRETVYNPSRPSGVFSRAADLTRAKRILGWEPKVHFDDGLKRTIEWYFSTKDPKTIRGNLQRLLTER